MRHLPFFLVLPAAITGTTLNIACAHAEDYLTIPQAQKVLFPNANIFLEASVTLTDSQMKEIKNITGVRQQQSVQKAWRAEANNELLGWFLVDDVIGKHDFITYGTAISVEGKVLGVEVLSYRETHGGQVRQPQWRANFMGKSLDNPLSLGSDIPNISGATLSCRNLTDGVKRMLAIHKIVLSHLDSEKK